MSGPVSFHPGGPYPLGATVVDGAVQFGIVSLNATRVWLALFDCPDANQPFAEFELPASLCRFGAVWSVRAEGAGAGTLYAYRVDGPREQARGHRFHPGVYLLDPWARAVAGDVAGGRGKSVVMAAPPEHADSRPGIPMEQTVIYETHVRGLTISDTSGVTEPGAYRGLIEKLPYLQSLGVTAVELLPIHVCGEHELDYPSPDGTPLVNYWGYNPIAYFAPSPRYASSGGDGAEVEEFREMVAACHAAGLEVILDVVFNHTAEKRDHNRTLSFRGIDNATYYMTNGNGELVDVTGCGNTVNCNHPVVRELILACLRYWVTAFQIDGFRFDLAAVLQRGRDGSLMECSPLVESITDDPVLRGTKFIAEPWDLAGGHLLGRFDGPAWAEWNGYYRDDMRRFWLGEGNMRWWFGLRFSGSPDFYARQGRGPTCSINFITAHDGFTLRDLVSYEHKHNEANGEGNRDGTEANHSTSCGVEGDSDNVEVNTLRLRLQKSFLATLLTSAGVPMILGGDEFGRTQRGNNNAYCQDSPISWYDWTLAEENKELLGFCREMIVFRKQNPVFTRQAYLAGWPGDSAAESDLHWFAADGHSSPWDGEDRCIGLQIDADVNAGAGLCLLFNPSAEARTFHLPDGAWRVCVDTAAHGTTEAPSPGQLAQVLVQGKALVILRQDEGKG